jgi:D-methionine transport system substrate-binding protein
MKTKYQTVGSLRVISSLLLVAVFAMLVSACGAAPTAAPTAAATEAATEAAAAETAAGTEAAAPAELTQLTIGVSPVPHGDIIKFVQENLAAKAGLDLKIVEFTDYVQPNLALADGSIDANFFQHAPYMEDFAKEHNLDLVAVAAVHIEPLGIYSKKVKSLADVQDGAMVTIPNDATNSGRALRLLEANGLIKLSDTAGLTATAQDIVENPKNLDIKELEAAQLARSLDDTTLAVINGNYAIDAGLKPNQDALALEKGENNPYANVLTVLKGRETDPAILKLAELLTSPEVKQFIEEKYQGSVIPAF